MLPVTTIYSGASQAVPYRLDRTHCGKGTHFDRTRCRPEGYRFDRKRVRSFTQRDESLILAAVPRMKTFGSLGAPRWEPNDRKRVRSSAPLVALRGAPKGRVRH